MEQNEFNSGLVMVGAKRGELLSRNRLLQKVSSLMFDVPWMSFMERLPGQGHSILQGRTHLSAFPPIIVNLQL